MALQYLNYTYPDMNHTNVSTMVGMAQWANQTTSYLFGFMILLGFFLIVMITLTSLTSSAKKGFITSATMTAMLSILMRGILLVSDTVVIVCIVLGILAVLWAMFGAEEVG